MTRATMNTNTNTFPAHWGAPPRMQTKDLRELPGGHGMGSGTLARWIQEHLDEDAQAGARPAPDLVPAGQPGVHSISQAPCCGGVAPYTRLHSTPILLAPQTGSLSIQTLLLTIHTRRFPVAPTGFYRGGVRVRPPHLGTFRLRLSVRLRLRPSVLARRVSPTPTQSDSDRVGFRPGRIFLRPGRIFKEKQR